ncbi:MAG: HNH endonuclease [Candidatus Thiodiazotropha sp. (ex Gloverina cf. vestifex)]|nr:HNH endonuclease [Candidatus Thiodiazotropha sp. (ex Gloverina cf. vestifex)]
MPSRLLSVCPHPGCNALTKGGRCQKHKVESNWQDDKRRGTRQQRGYGAEWQRIRKRILKRDGYLCQVCRMRDATQVDHIVPKVKGGTDDPANLRAICKPCHATKTQRDSR